MSPSDPKQPNAPSGGAATSSPTAVKFDKGPADMVLPTLFGKGYGTYTARPENYALSFVSHTAIIALIMWLFHVTIQPEILTPTIAHSIELSDYVMKVGKGGPSGGGGGDASKLKASTGVPPKSAKQQFAPPVVLQQQKSKLMMEPTVI